MLNHADILHLEKRLNGLFRALNQKTRPDRLQLVGRLAEKSQKIVILARWKRSFPDRNIAVDLSLVRYCRSGGSFEGLFGLF
jgi:hypothetical protein